MVSNTRKTLTEFSMPVDSKKNILNLQVHGYMNHLSSVTL